MRRLILVKHSLPEVDRERPAETWRLSDEGRDRCIPLAAALRRYSPNLVAASDEPKAAETATALAASLGLTLLTDPELREQRRRGVTWLAPDAWHAAIEAGFRQLHEPVFGEETFAAAEQRFGAAIDKLLVQSSAKTPTIVAHGTVISLFVAARTGQDGFALWKTLGLPSFVVLELNPWKVVAVVSDMFS